MKNINEVTMLAAAKAASSATGATATDRLISMRAAEKFMVEMSMLYRQRFQPGQDGLKTTIFICDNVDGRSNRMEIKET